MPINRVKSAGIENNTIKGDDVSTNTIDTAKLGGSITGDKLIDGVIDNNKINTSAAIANDKLANSSFTLNGVSVSLGGSTTISGSLDWQPVIVADGSTQQNLEAGKAYFMDTNSGIIEAFLPASPSLGDTITILDYGQQFSTNKVIINTQGQKINGAVGDGVGPNEFELTRSNGVFELVYLDTDKGWIVKTSTTIT